ncbi:MAG: SDR family NAD(P)-dependent oxidoreductase [Thermoleophilia bacterium]|nr:SDR family NAD(P)-dependent oxidoreductase [Thermoleophilia bacterium]
MALFGRKLAEFVDQGMDFAVVPGFSAIGYRARKRMFSWQPVWLEGRTVMVTGANSGLGKAAALDLARCGAEVHMVCRNREKGESARDEIANLSGAEPTLHICDLSDLESIRTFAREFLEADEDLDVLINNAGVMPPEREHTNDGFELTFATNVLGPFLLTELLMDRLKESDDGRVVTMSSGGMYSSGFNLDDPQLDRRDYSPTAFYAQAKRAEVMLSEEWNRRHSPAGPIFYSVHPGWAVTPGMSKALPGFHRVLGPILRTPAEGADTAVWLCGAAPEDAPGGEFFEDRTPRPKYRIPRTRESPEDRRKLYELCQELTGITPD